MTHIKFNYSNKEYNIVLLLTDKPIQRVQVIIDDKLFYVCTEMTQNTINVFHVTEEIFESHTLVHTQQVKKAVLRATKFLEWYLDDMDTFFDLMQDAKMYLRRNGKITLSIFDIFKNCAYVPESLCVNIKEESNVDDEYDIEEILFLDDYQDEPKYYML